MKNVTVIIVLSLLVFGVTSICSGAGPARNALLNWRKCRAVCVPNERWKQGAFLTAQKKRNVASPGRAVRGV